MSYKKIDENTLKQHFDCPAPGEYNGVRITSSLTRTFNFLAREIIVKNTEARYEARGSSGGSAAVSSQIIIQRFSELDSLDEVELMHARLVELGGTPPPLSEITGKLTKSSSPAARLQPRGT